MSVYTEIVKKTDRSIFAQNLIALRKNKGLSQRDLARVSGISDRMIAYYETNTVIPPIDKLEILSKALDISISQLVDPESSDKDVLKYNTRTLKRIKLLQQLPPEDQRKVETYIKDLLEKNNISS
jgi:transcriptional regulator with XRE-family HTH domain